MRALNVANTPYFLQVHRMAALNEDTTAAAFHVLAQVRHESA